MPDVILQSTITCPDCGHAQVDTMPTNACQWFYECAGCGKLLEPRAGRLLRVLLVRHGEVPADAAGARLLLVRAWKISDDRRARQLQRGAARFVELHVLDGNASDGR